MDAEENKYRVYLEEHRALVAGEHKGADVLDEQLLKLSAGAFGISLVFLKDIAAEPELGSMVYLKTSWTALILSMLVTLFSSLSTQYAHRKQRKNLEAEFYQNLPRGSGKNIWAEVTAKSNVVSILSFAVGIVALAYFSIVNVGHKPNDVSRSKPENNMAIDNKPEYGQRGRVVQETPKPPPTNSVVPAPRENIGRVPTSPPKPPPKPRDK